MKKINSNPVKTVLTIATGLLVVYCVLIYKSEEGFDKLDWIPVTAAILGLAGVFSTFLSKQIEFLWMKLASLLSYIVPNIVLGTIFYIFLFPIALLSRIGGKDPLSLRNDPDSIYKEGTKNFDKASFEKPW